MDHTIAGMNDSPKPPRRVNTTTDDALGDLDTVALAAEIDARRVHPSELIEAALTRTHAAEPHINAVVTWIPAPTPAAGPFAGVPSFLKDNEDLAGYPTSQGSLAVPRRNRRRSTVFPQQFQQLGFTLLGKTTLPEFGLTATTESNALGATRNPWNLDHSTGGSSGGSAALVAAGVVPLAHSNDGGGSTRIPASCCGLVGLKPTTGRLIPIEHVDQLPVAVATQGVVTRTVRDTARFMFEAEKVFRDPRLPVLGHVTRPNRRRLRIGVYDEGMRHYQVDPDTRRTVAAAAELCESLGHQVDLIGYPFPEGLAPHFLRYWELLARGIVALGPRLYGQGFDPQALEPYTVGLGRHLRASAEQLPFSIMRLRRFAGQYTSYFGQYDILVSPVLGHEPPPIGYLGPDVPFETHLVRLLRFAPFTALQNATGGPAISLPLGTSGNGLPIGVQFAAPLGADRSLLELAYELETARPWTATPPL
jgi:amidase